MKNVLVIGSTGAMDRYLVPELARMGYAVTEALKASATTAFAYVAPDTDVGKRMDEYLEKNGL